MQGNEARFGRRQVFSEPEAPQPASDRRRWLRYVARVFIVFAAGFVVRHYGHDLLRPGAPTAVVAGAPLVPGDASAIPALAGVENVSVMYYDIDATDAHAIRAELDSRSSHFRGERFDGLSTWNYRWHWNAASDGGCGTADAEIDFSAQLTLPRLTRPASLSPELARAWQSYMDAMIRHEANHLRQAYQAREWVAHEVRTADCATANARGEAAVRETDRQAAAYDAATRHGALEGVVFPPRPAGRVLAGG